MEARFSVQYRPSGTGGFIASVRCSLPTGHDGKLHPLIVAPEELLLGEQLLPDWGEQAGTWRVNVWTSGIEPDPDTLSRHVSRKISLWRAILERVVHHNRAALPLEDREIVVEL